MRTTSALPTATGTNPITGTTTSVFVAFYRFHSVSRPEYTAFTDAARVPRKASPGASRLAAKPGKYPKARLPVTTNVTWGRAIFSANRLFLLASAKHQPGSAAPKFDHTLPPHGLSLARGNAVKLSQRIAWII